MDVVMHDLRFALRSLARRPTFTIVAALTLALGIGATTAVFSVVDAVLIRPLPYEHPDRVVLVWGTQGEQKGQGVVYADYLDWRTRNRTFSEIGAFRPQSVNVTGTEAPERLVGCFVSASFLRVIGARMSQGRAFTDAETEVATTSPVAILSYESWQSKFGADRAILGRPVTINGTTLTIVGIMAPRMPVPMWAGAPPDVMLPIGYYPNAGAFQRGQRGILVAGRLRPGVTVDAAQRDLSAIAAQLAREYPTTNAGTGADVIALRDQVVGRVRPRLYMILAAVAIVLLVACANVANLQLARGASRARELSVRAALGAGRRRVAQQLLTESVVLSVVGGLAGVLLAVAIVKLLIATMGAALPVDASDIRVDSAVLMFALVVSVATGIGFGVAPAWKASRASLEGMLRARTSEALGHAAMRSALAVAQLALSLALLAAAGLITRSLMAIERVDPGFDSRHVLTAQFRLPAAEYDTPEKIWAMFDRAIAEVRSVPGVESAAFVRASPFSQNGDSYPVEIGGRPSAKAGDAPMVLVNAITPGYFATLRIPVLSGRDVATTDRLGTPPVLVINRTLAEKFWPRESPIGKRLRIAGETDWRTIVGVVGDTKHFMLGETQFLQGYIPYAQRPQIFTSIVARTTGDPLDLVKGVTAAIQRVDRNQPVWGFSTLERDVDGGIGSTRPMTWLMGLFAIVALVVAVVGIYGVMSYTVSQRVQEVGIRIALGAEARQVVRMVLAEAARLIAVSIAIGVAASLALTHMLRSQLYGVGPGDLLTFVLAAVTLGGAALAGCYLPARRASRVDPITALRAE